MLTPLHEASMSSHRMLLEHRETVQTASYQSDTGQLNGALLSQPSIQEPFWDSFWLVNSKSGLGSHLETFEVLN